MKTAGLQRWPLSNSNWRLHAIGLQSLATAIQKSRLASSVLRNCAVRVVQLVSISLPRTIKALQAFTSLQQMMSLQNRSSLSTQAESADNEIFEMSAATEKTFNYPTYLLSDVPCLLVLNDQPYPGGSKGDKRTYYAEQC